MSLDRDDLFFRQFLDWYIGKTIYRVIGGRVPRHWWDIGPWPMPKLEEMIIEKITITKHGVYAVLDKYIDTGKCDDPEIVKKIKQLHEKNLFKSKSMPKYLVDGYYDDAYADMQYV